MRQQIFETCEMLELEDDACLKIPSYKRKRLKSIEK